MRICAHVKLSKGRVPPTTRWLCVCDKTRSFIQFRIKLKHHALLQTRTHLAISETYRVSPQSDPDYILSFYKNQHRTKWPLHQLKVWCGVHVASVKKNVTLRTPAGSQWPRSAEQLLICRLVNTQRWFDLISKSKSQSSFDCYKAACSAEATVK